MTTLPETDLGAVLFSQAPDEQSSTKAEIRKSFLDLVKECDNFPHHATDPSLYSRLITANYHLLIPHHAQSLGLVLPSVAVLFDNLAEWELDHDLKTLTLVVPGDDGSPTYRAARSNVVEATTAAMRTTRHFKVLEGWRDELYPVFSEQGQILFEVERAAAALLGIVTYGVHMTAYMRRPMNEVNHKSSGEVSSGSSGHAVHVWVARRSPTKQTYPGYLDNSVAGGLAVGETPMSCLVRESSEEASLPESMVRSLAKSVGTVSYFHVRDPRAGGESGLMQPECQYVYDMELPADTVPKPGGDGEVDTFELWDVEKVKAALTGGEFKPNCAVVLLDFLVRHGLLAAEKEKDYTEIVARMHRLLEFPTARF